jgi:cytochrome c nitrite reductase small subunit
MRTKPMPTNPRRWGLIGAICLVVGIIAFVASAQATDAPTFCGTCHEMQPYYEAWAAGHHKTSAQCVDCHVDDGFIARLAHKPYALPEVWAHFTGYGGFPMASPTVVPDSRCVRCHPTVKLKTPSTRFSHELHAKQGPCQMCHATTGHDVPARALKAAGVYNAQNAALRAQAGAATPAAPGTGKANIPGHIAVSCSECHNMAPMQCQACHTPPHEPRGDCGQCHRPGPRFTFAHPPTQMENWQSIPCRQCHPVSYRQVNCTCHGGGAPRGGD